MLSDIKQCEYYEQPICALYPYYDPPCRRRGWVVKKNHQCIKKPTSFQKRRFFYYDNNIMIHMSNQENRKHNTSIVTGRIDGKFLQNGDPFHQAITVSLQEVWARLGLTDNPILYENMGPAVIPLLKETAHVFDHHGRLKAIKETIFNQDGSIQSEARYQTR
ncbi:MAG: hypothetical protein UW52_C0023G0012 [Candidatus Gottesmanbacteria bacterium GW2011_GWA1_44_24b]|uniref:Uncharacterized protein n=1 Tax=Candidatus Gottesmanbacteria bacterium GW2011_GWA1_44_24b TaxID=1618437 RepID=A0A0G1LKY8_9BACT|nr:MAG: hypothetical protein UW52_C0023G0012 [Candidatus Gottesmanbacteria bacterium GW2011_GWA1_44_24b]